ncbi:proteinaceous RNase P 1, chloroplastic/mitochondrial isoform X2 [Neltuma alba]|uniref:proteinaceous RNase P 1, chloroplastic/mitochondrial isoform X2 n=1 Tax=Neltuma alba TaxID=207710 RepID=UPI0010A4A2F2|nr:proteinaceous RNase P 1, chloroplastic/mitochondrial-like isoform X2 [Prosopis alba]XP_028805992.1 proteinaceous RNase P 1, chloroplastic/mitochondrial-like isoform X2 [Prosopis alba]
MLRSCLVVKLTPHFSFFTQYPRPLNCWRFRCGSSRLCYYNSCINIKCTLNNKFSYSFLGDQKSHLSTSSQTAASLVECSGGITNRLSNKAKRKAINESPEGVLRHKLNKCSKDGDMVEALKLYDEARSNGVALNAHHYNIVLYLCSSHASVKTENKSDENTLNLGLKRGFEIFQQMLIDEVAPNEATFTSAARLAAARDDPQMAFELLKRMKSCGIAPKLRSYEPALFGFCKRGDTDKAYEVDADMIASGIMAEEPELSALLKLSVGAKKEVKVYEMLHRLRATVRQVSESTLQIIEDWFNSEHAAKVGEKHWDVNIIRKGIAQGGGGWHGQGWLGSGQWKVVKTHITDAGMCLSCSEKLVSIDIDPKETENFATSLTRLACQREAKANFNHFQKWLQRHGPFDAVVDGANVSLVNTQNFSFLQLNSVVQQLQEMSPSKRLPLVILHVSRVTSGPAQKPHNKKLLEYWKKNGALYATPQGSNDDWYWLYAAVSCKSLLVTNDEMRDHLFQLLGSSFFPRWKERHQVRLLTSNSRPSLIMPPPYSTVIQESDNGSWHVPTVSDDDYETPRQWLCATRSRNVSSLRQLWTSSSTSMAA